MVDSEKLADRIVKAIVKDLSGRRGLRHEWDHIDDDIKQEIVAVWKDIVIRSIQREEAG